MLTRFHPILFLVFGALIFPLCAEDEDEPEIAKEDVEFTEARKLFWSAQYEDSEKLFKIYQSTHPDHAPTKSFLQMIGQYRRWKAVGPEKYRQLIVETRQRLEETMVEKLELKDVEWREVAARLQELANSQKDGKAPKDSVLFINLLPSGLSAKLSLKLSRVTLLRAIESACQQARLRYVVDAWAVIIDLPESQKK